ATAAADRHRQAFSAGIIGSRGFDTSIRSGLRRGLFGLPVSGGDEWLMAHSADDLFKRRVVAACRDKKCTDRDLGRVFEVFTGQPAKPQPGACRSLEQQSANMRLFLPPAAQFDRVVDRKS